MKKFFQQRPVKKDYNTLYNHIKSTYKRWKEDKNFPTATVDPNVYSIAYTEDKSANDTHLMFRDHGNGVYKITDFSIKTAAGTNYHFENISKEDFEKWKHLIIEIEEFLHQQEKEKIENKKIKVSATGDFNFNVTDEEMAQLEFNDNLMKAFKDKLKDLEFEAEYRVWDGPHSNKKVIADVLITITGFSVNSNYSLNIAAKSNVETGDGFYDGELHISDKTPISYFDFKAHPIHKLYDIIRFTPKYSDDNDLTRREKKQKFNKTKYPSIISVELTPTNYRTIEFLTDMRGLIEAIKSGTPGEEEAM